MRAFNLASLAACHWYTYAVLLASSPEARQATTPVASILHSKEEELASEWWDEKKREIIKSQG